MDNIAANFPDISFIDNTTIDEVAAQMVNDYQDKYKELTGREVSLAQADPYRLIMYACAIQIYQSMQYEDYAGKMGLLKYSRDNYLDNLAALRGIQRIEATPAVTTLQFTIESAIASAVAIPAGTRVTNGNDIYFATDEYAEIPSGQTAVTVTATCTATGLSGNNFEAGEVNILVNTLPYISAVTNTVKSYGGTDREDDNSLKDRIYNILNAYSTAGPDGAYQYYTKSVDPSIEDVIVQSPTAGVVDIRFVCTGGEIPSDALVQRVADALNDRFVRPLTDNITVLKPEISNYDVNLQYWISYSNKSAVATIQTDVNTAVTIYNDWQSGKIGRDINPSYLIQKIMEAGAKRVVINSPAYTITPADTVAKVGAITVTYGGIEDD
jgi:phage-related baseplate assembly protein